MFKMVASDARQFITMYVKDRFEIKEMLFDPTTSHQNKKNAERFDMYEAVCLAGD